MPQWRALGDPVYLVAALNNYAAVLFDLERLEEAAALFEECIALARATASVHILALALANLGAIRLRRPSAASPRELLVESLGLLRAAEDRFGMVGVLCFLGEDAENGGDAAQARA